MRGWGIIITAGLIAFSGCKTGSKTSDENGRVPGEPASRPKTPQSKDPLTGTHWLDNPTGASGDATPPAGTWTNPNDPNYDYKTEARGQLAGFVEDINGRKIGNAYVRVEQVGGTQAKPYGVYTTTDGSFLLPGLKPGASYTITVEARDQDRTLVGRAVAKAPNVRLRIPVMEGELPKTSSNDEPPPGLKPGKGEKAPTSAIPSGDLAPPPLWQGSKSSNDLPVPVPLGQDTKVFPARGNDLPGDYSPTEPAPNWNAAPPIGGEPVPTVRPEMMTGDKNPDWKAPTANITPKPIPVPLPPERESKRLPRAEQFQLVDTLGRTRNFPAGRPGELILLDFMTTNCIPCQKMIPTLTAIQEKYAARGLDVVAVACDDESLRTRSVVADRYRKKYDLNYQLYAETADRPGPLLKRFNIERYPTVVLINSSGAVVWQGHPSKTNELVAAIEQQLEAAGR
jgi:thiol-disulfide isomerase/thioredoxin